VSILGLWSVLSGYLVISVRGPAAEKFINMAVKSGAHLWDISAGDGESTLKVSVDDFFELRHLARKTGCRLHIVRKVGFPFFYYRLIRRRGMVLGVTFFIACLYLLSSIILFIGVEGADTIGEERIRVLADELGVRPGIMKKGLEKEQLANEMIIREPDISWVSFKMRGTRLVIEVVERIKKPPVQSDSANLVATKDGLIVDVLVVMGEARVKAGDTVIRGQLLIEGMLRPQDPLAAPGAPEVVTIPVHAQGEVWARVWYEGYGESSLQQVTRSRTGKRTATWYLLVDGQEVLRLGRKQIPYRNYEVQTIKRDFSKRNFQLPVELITEYAYELALEYTLLSHEQALEVAAERGRILAELQLPAGVAVKATSVEELEIEDTELVGVRYIIETLENIVTEEDLEAMDGLDD
jgi:similar to stage IV sporulation protein